MTISTLVPSIRSRLAACGLATLIAACGGGGGADPAAQDTAEGIPAAPTAVLVATQAEATALVRLAEQRTRDLRLAAGVTAVPQAAQVGGVQALTLRRQADPALARIQAVQDNSAALCSSGGLSVTIDDALLARFEADPNAQMAAGDAIAVSAAGCVIKAPLALGDVALGEFGVGARIDGSFRLLLEQRSGSDFLFALTYSGFSYTPVGGAAFDPLNAVLRFGTVGGVERYSLDLNDTRLLQAPEVSATGNTIAVAAARLRTALASGRHADLGYTDWVLDTVSQRASAGTVQVLGAGSTQATITAGAGGYRVVFSLAGANSGFDVPR